MAWKVSHDKAKELKIHSWSQKEWQEFKNNHIFAGNVMVTFNNFYNEIHTDSSDLWMSQIEMA